MKKSTLTSVVLMVLGGASIALASPLPIERDVLIILGVVLITGSYHAYTEGWFD